MQKNNSENAISCERCAKCFYGSGINVSIEQTSFECCSRKSDSERRANLALLNMTGGNAG